jgi:hypothetical protein
LTRVQKDYTPKKTITKTTKNVKSFNHSRKIQRKMSHTQLLWIIIGHFLSITMMHEYAPSICTFLLEQWNENNKKLTIQMSQMQVLNNESNYYFTNVVNRWIMQGLLIISSSVPYWRERMTDEMDNRNTCDFKTQPINEMNLKKEV